MEGLSFIFRRMTFKDSVNATKMERRIFPDNPVLIFDLILNASRGNICYVCLVEEEIVGAVRVADKPEENCYEVTSLAVAQSYRRMGIGKELMEIALRAIRHAGQRNKVRLDVRAKNRGAFKLYRSLGFCEVMRKKNVYYFGDDGITMEKFLQ
ncbi:hypothetical protein ENBRE01_0149 [Enteropsectra breve]|nr:hypothetical protein ENBRE01_0149 [Enteropsectra breve]